VLFALVQELLALGLQLLDLLTYRRKIRADARASEVLAVFLLECFKR